jgi:hypothetical protein
VISGIVHLNKVIKCISELVYQTAVFFWYLNDFEGVDQCVSWRVNPNAFAVRKSVWEITNGFDTDYENIQMQALDFGLIIVSRRIPLYIKKFIFKCNY